MLRDSENSHYCICEHDVSKDTEERASEAGRDTGARKALSRHGRVGDQICKHRGAHKQTRTTQSRVNRPHGKISHDTMCPSGRVAERVRWGGGGPRPMMQ